MFSTNTGTWLNVNIDVLWGMKKLLGILVLGLLISNNVEAASIAEELTQLNNLFKEKAITKEEFSKAKSILLKTETKPEVKI